jgi:hypothetical protein
MQCSWSTLGWGRPQWMDFRCLYLEMFLNLESQGFQIRIPDFEVGLTKFRNFHFEWHLDIIKWHLALEYAVVFQSMGRHNSYVVQCKWWKCLCLYNTSFGFPHLQMEKGVLSELETEIHNSEMLPNINISWTELGYLNQCMQINLQCCSPECSCPDPEVSGL